MSDTNTNVEFVDISHAPSDDHSEAGPGDILRNARLAQGLSESDMAKKMFLSRDKITALERNEYHKLAGNAFIRGYIRSYASIVHLDADDLVARFNTLGLKEADLPTAPVTYVRKQVGINDKVIKYVSYGIGLVLIALVVTWWNGHSVKTDAPSLVKQFIPSLEEGLSAQQVAGVSDEAEQDKTS